MNTDYAQELLIALRAARLAAQVCARVQATLVTADALEKKDRSPVTVADFAAQAVVCSLLAEHFPTDAVVGEEGAAELRQPTENAAIPRAVVDQVRRALDRDVSAAQVFDWIDRGAGDGSTRRYWTLDPVDGTKGFLRRQQYAVALALIEDHEVKLGVLACPNLATETGVGVIAAAVRGQGARLLIDGLISPDSHLDFASAARLRVSAVADPAAARFCESVDSGHSDQAAAEAIARRLGIAQPALRMDSQVKYAAVARGDAQIYLRLPAQQGYEEKVWDHAAGSIVVQEAGGIVTDIAGKPLDFSRGRTLANNRGIVASNVAFHRQVLDAVAAATSR